MSTEETKAAAPSYPPSVGTPCWISIPATDVPRAKNFFESALNWQFKPAGAEYPASELAMIHFTDPSVPFLGGGIVKVAADCHIAGVGSCLNYYQVSDVDEYLEKVKQAGGRVAKEKEPQGDIGFIAQFFDTEGNVHGIFAPVA
ncbi:MAG: hypothetical protein M1829_001981 [Trizodia sp. TS-e1964]|nr:MAG: hypothetical protein M1829_001981 [Trizodia sp. TS-e1964]